MELGYEATLRTGPYHPGQSVAAGTVWESRTGLVRVRIQHSNSVHVWWAEEGEVGDGWFGDCDIRAFTQVYHQVQEEELPCADHAAESEFNQWVPSTT